MTRDGLKATLNFILGDEKKERQILDAVDKYISSQNSANALVSGSLELLAQLLKRESEAAKTEPNDVKAGEHYANWTSIEDVMRSVPLTEGAMKTNVKRAVMGLMAAPPPPPKPSRDVSGGNDR